MKVRKLPCETVGPARKKRKKPDKNFGIEVRYMGATPGWMNRDGDWHADHWCGGWFVKESDRNHELAKRQRGWEKYNYEFRKIDR